MYPPSAKMNLIDPIHIGINVANINFWTCKKIRDVLTSDKDTAAKNWLGQYKSQATKDWEVRTDVHTFHSRSFPPPKPSRAQAIIALYQKDNVHLAEAAGIIFQNGQ